MERIGVMRNKRGLGTALLCALIAVSGSTAPEKKAEEEKKAAAVEG